MMMICHYYVHHVCIGAAQMWGEKFMHKSLARTMRIGRYISDVTKNFISEEMHEIIVTREMQCVHSSHS